MIQFDASNTIFQKAVAFINQTNRHLFLTGKAGTGKTTFLKYIRNNCYKKTAIVAPTGVAAINAGGVTIHSFFQVPLGTYLPTRSSHFNDYDGRVNNQHTLFKNLRMNAAKKDLLQELELLIIDEVSMVRADTLDAIDAILRHARRQPLVPFGGVQVLYIGDLFQLPPVVKPEEWQLLQQFYKSPFFFDSLAIQQSQPVYIELKKIYRQSDPQFIDILNNIRNNCCTTEDLEHLHRYYQPGFHPLPEENYITLTTHNDRADTINRIGLENLEGKLFTFPAVITGEFSERSYPAEVELNLKVGAQIMFIKNDKGENRRYFNGKIGIIHSIEEDKIVVSFPGEEDMLDLEKETWQNIRYRYNKEKDTFEEEEIGTFTQYPVRLAWAITIHKSQGLTFEKAIIDAGSSFAPGQVYVALSRMTGLEGMVLRSRIQPDVIMTDDRVLQFIRSEEAEDALQQTLELEQQAFIREVIRKKFSWVRICEVLQQNLDEYENRMIPGYQESVQWAASMVDKANALKEVADKFLRQLDRLFAESDQQGYEPLHQRTTAAVQYFVKEVDEGLLASLNAHITEVRMRDKVRKYLKDLGDLKLLIERQRQHLMQAAELTKAMLGAADVQALLELAESMQKPLSAEGQSELAADEKKAKRQKGDSQKITLRMFREGKKVEEIASERNLVVGTIETHLISFIASGEVDVLELVSQEKFNRIMEIVDAEPDINSYGIKDRLGDDYSWNEIRAVLAKRAAASGELGITANVKE